MEREAKSMFAYFSVLPGMVFIVSLWGFISGVLLGFLSPSGLSLFLICIVLSFLGIISGVLAGKTEEFWQEKLFSVVFLISSITIFVVYLILWPLFYNAWLLESFLSSRTDDLIAPYATVILAGIAMLSGIYMVYSSYHDSY